MTPIWRENVTLERLNAHIRNSLDEYIGMEFTELGPDFLRAQMPVVQRITQPMGLLHGGASVVMAEALGSMAANSVLTSNKFMCVGQDVNANHLRSARIGSLVIGTARPIHIGSRSQVWGIELVNERDQKICVARLTMATIERPDTLPAL